ncbi:MAG: hypothetical protein WCW66_03785 [Patescibacteria group bacterium]|jgi:hypothetical protein
MKIKSKKILKTASLKVSKVAVFCLIIGVFAFFGGIMAPKFVFSAVWQNPTVTPPNYPADLQPPLNTSPSTQEKKGGLYVATQDGALVIGTALDPGTNKLYVDGTTTLDGDVLMNSNLSVSNTANVSNLIAGDATISNSLNVNSGLLRTVNDQIFINTASGPGKLNITSANQSAIVAYGSTEGAIITATNVGASGGGGVDATGFDYGIAGSSTNGYGVLADAGSGGIAGLYAKASNSAYGAVGRGLYGVVGFDNTENIDNPVFNGPAGTLAALFEGSVEIVPSAGGNADFTVDTSTFVVNSSTNRIGIGTISPSVRLHTLGVDNQSAIYAQAGTNTIWQNHGGPTETVSGVYGEGGTITYNGAGTGWNFGVFGKAGNPGTGRTVGIMGVDFTGAPNSYAGYFEGKVEVVGQMSVTGSADIGDTLTVTGDIVGYGDLNLIGTNSDINMTGTDSDITMTGGINAGGDITHYGKLIMTGGLPALAGGVATDCNVEPENYAEGTLFVCYWCPSLVTQRMHAVMARMDGKWINIGYTKGSLCSIPYDPEVPRDSLP